MSDDQHNDNKDKGLNRRNLLLNATALSSLGAVAATVGGGDALAQQARPAAPKMGEVLPIAAPKQPPITEPDWRKVPQPKPLSIRPPKGAPTSWSSFKTRPPMRTHRHSADRSISRPWIVSRKKG